MGQTFYLQGEHTYSYKELAEYVIEQINRPNTQFVDLPLKYAQIVGRAVELLPNPLVTRDLFNLMTEDQVGKLHNGAHLKVERCNRRHLFSADASKPGLAALGLSPASFESKAFNFLYKYRSGGHFVDPNAAHH